MRTKTFFVDDRLLGETNHEIDKFISRDDIEVLETVRETYRLNHPYEIVTIYFKKKEK